jgi:hypothetical protein
MSKKSLDTNIKNIIKNHSNDRLVDLLMRYSNEEINFPDYIIGYSLTYNNLHSFKYYINRINYIPYFLLRRLLRQTYNIEFTEIILDVLEKPETLENTEVSKICKIYGQLLASLLKFHPNIKDLIQRILDNNIFNFEEIIKNDNYRVNIIPISLNNTFRVQNLEAVIYLMTPYYNKNNIPLEELVYVILYKYRHLKKTFVLKQLSSFKGLLDLNYKTNLDSKEVIYYFSYDEQDEEDEEDEEDYEEPDLTTPNCNNIKLGSLFKYYKMDTKYFNKDKIEFVEDLEDMEKIKAFKEYYKIKDIK